MKLRIRCRRDTKIFTVSDGRNANTTIAEIRDAVAELFNNIGNFHLSLNNSDVLADETKTLADYGVVGGDLIYVMVEKSAGTSESMDTAATGCSAQPIPSTDTSNLTSYHTVSNWPETNTGNCGSEQMDTLSQSISKENQSTDFGAQPKKDMVSQSSNSENQPSETGAQLQVPDCDPVDYAVVNKCLQEPVLCRDASETNVPSLLQEVHEVARPQDNVEALSVLLHVLMLETGYVNYPQLAVNTASVSVLPATWRQPGCHRFEYTYPGCQDTTCSITVISTGTTTIVRGKVSGDHSVTRQCTLKPADFVHEPVTDVSHSYHNLARLSMVFKDSIANPLVSDMRIVAGIEDLYGLLALNQEVKFKVLSNLDVKSLLRVSRVNSEMYNLSQDTYLWRRLYLKDFGNRKDNSLSQDWRKLYIQEYKSRKERKKMLSRMTVITPPTWGPPNSPFAGPSNWIPPGPGMIGGDYDLFPNFPGGLPGIPGRMGPHQPMLPRPRYDLIGPNPDHQPDIPGMAPMMPRGPRFGGRGNPFGSFGPRFF